MHHASPVPDDETSPTIQQSPPPPPPPEYAHSGRGGAGNWYSPREERQQLSTVTRPIEGRDRAAILPCSTTSSHPNRNTTRDGTESGHVPIRARGRGGAGNFEYQRQLDEQRRRASEEMQEMQEMTSATINDRVVMDVERGLIPPARVFLGRS